MLLFFYEESLHETQTICSLNKYSLSISSAVSVTGSLLSGIHVFRDLPSLTVCNISVCTRSRTEVNQNNIWM